MELLCIETHPKGLVKSGNTYTLVSDKSPCKCKVVNVGLVDPDIKYPVTMCVDCGVRYKSDSIFWVYASRFAVIATEEEVKQSEQKLELINN